MYFIEMGKIANLNSEYELNFLLSYTEGNMNSTNLTTQVYMISSLSI